MNKDKLLPKLNSFYDNCVAPELVSPVHILGLPIRNLSNVISVLKFEIFHKYNMYPCIHIIKYFTNVIIVY